jgi:predicted nucleic-acid-binding Zn-ribbon protein
MKKCSKCGAKMIADRSQVFTSYPPQYMYRCPKCDNTEYGLCSEDYTDEGNEDKETIDDNCINWYTIRNLAAMFAMNGLIASGNYRMEDVVAKMSVAYANALITELKKL